MMEVIPLTGGLGAEIFGADLRKEADFPQIQEAFAKYSVIVMRGQTITPNDQIRFAGRFGPVSHNRFLRPLDGHPGIVEVLKEKHHKEAIGEVWHADETYDEIPSLGSILHGIELPPYGGDTMFASMGAAYEALSPAMQDFLQGLSAWHGSAHNFGRASADRESRRDGRIGNFDQVKDDVLHPVVIRHPLSGRKCLYVNPGFTLRIEGMEKAESAALLAFLYDHCKQPEFHCRVRWRAGDVTMWDNRAVWHKALNDYHGFRRYMHRITVQGCALEPARGDARRTAVA